MITASLATLKRQAENNYTRFHWPEFSSTPTAERLIEKYGEQAVKDCFEKVAARDGVDGLATTDAAPLVAAPPASPLEGALVTYASGQLIDDYVRQRWGGFAPNDVVGEANQLDFTLRNAGVSCEVVATGYRDAAPRRRQVTELTLAQLPSEDWQQILGSRALQRAIGACFGPGTRWGRLHHRYDRAVQKAVIALEAPGELRPARATATLADHITHHNQALESWQQAIELGIIAAHDNVLLHVDAHSDLYFNSFGTRSIADYINNAVGDGWVKEIYWVVPDTMLPVEETTLRQTQADAFQAWPVLLEKETPYDLRLWVDHGVLMRKRPEGAEAATAREVVLHVRHLDQVPASALAGRGDVLLDVDLDYFSNCGHDSSSGTVHNTSRAQLRHNLEHFGDFCHRLQPAFATLCLSPEYTSGEDQAAVQGYFRQLFPEDLRANRHDAYQLTNNQCTDESLLEILKTSVALPALPFFSPELHQSLHNRGLEDVASAYERYCHGEIKRGTMLRWINRALGPAEAGDSAFS